ncbi:MAG: helix-turn-helix transcriptional regulator [Phenylobacterium sp.]|nr:helix-turn-helix transcriptional regulator [Phenylobacterium sp.]
MSRSYASELVKRKKTPSLEMAARIEREFGVPLSAWIPGKAGDGAEDVAGQDMGGEGACPAAASPGKIVEVSGEA